MVFYNDVQYWTDIFYVQKIELNQAKNVFISISLILLLIHTGAWTSFIYETLL